MPTVIDAIKNLLVDDFGANVVLSQRIKAYYDFATNCLAKESLPSFVTSREFV